VIDIWVTKPGYIGRVLRVQIRAGKPPAARQLCLPVRARQPAACG
jgi:hypothetical protein